MFRSSGWLSSYLLFAALILSFLAVSTAVNAQTAGTAYPSTGLRFIPPYSGFQLSDGVKTTFIRSGSVVVMGVDGNSPALAAGLRGGDVLLAANGKRVCQGDDPGRLISASGVGSEVTITYARDGRIMTAKLRVANRPDFDPGYVAGLEASQRINASWERNDFKTVAHECERLRDPNLFFVNSACGLAFYYRRSWKQAESVFTTAEASCPACADAFAKHALGRQNVGYAYLDQWNIADKLMKDFRTAQDKAFAALDADITAQMKDFAEKGQFREALDRYASFANDEAECRDTPPSQPLAELVANLTLRENPSLQASQPARRKAELARSLKKVANNSAELTKAYGSMNSAIWLAPWWSAAYADAADMLEALGSPTESMDLANRALALPRAKADVAEPATAGAAGDLAADATATPETMLKSCMAGLAAAETGSAEARQLKNRCIKAAQKLNPAPEVPAEAERHVARGQAGMEMGQSPAEFAEAAAEFERAIRLAPWWADAYHGSAMALDKAASYQQAIDAYQFYLLAAPGAADAKEVKSKIYKLEFAAEREQKQAIEKSMAQRQLAARTQGLQGIWKEKGNGMVWQASIQNGMFVANKSGSVQEGSWTYSGQFVIKAALNGNQMAGTYTQPSSMEKVSTCGATGSEQPLTGTIDDDAKTITLKYQTPVYTSDYVKATLLTNARCIKVQKMRDDMKIVVIEKQ